jgi:hypothetical protein
MKNKYEYSRVPLTPEEYTQQKKKLGLPENALDELLSSLKPQVKVVYYRNKKK